MVFSNNLLFAAAAAASDDSGFNTSLIGNSVWFDSSDLLTQDTAESDSGRKEAIFSTWVQRTKIGEQQFLLAVNGSNVNDYLALDFQSDDTLRLLASSTSILVTTQLFRDIGWYHILVTIDTSQNNNDSQKIFVNGTEITNFATRNNFGSSADIAWGRNATHVISSSPSSVGSNTMIGYMAQTALITDKSFQQGDFSITDFLDTFTLGTNGSQFIPKADGDIATIAGTGGNNSFSFDFSNSSDLGNDTSGNNNDFTATSMAAANQTEHTPSLSYPVFNVLCPKFTDGGTWTVGNTKIVSTSEQTDAIGTLPPVSTGKYYYQWVFTDNATSGNCKVGMTPIDNWDGETFSTTSSGDIFYADHRNALFRKGSTTVTSILGSSGTYALAFDLDAGKVWVGSVDTSDGSIDWFNSSGGTDGDPANGTNPTATFTANTVMIPFAMVGKASGTSWTIEWNFGQFGFGNSDVPTGFKKLNSKNLTAPEFQGIDFFDTTLYEGNGTGQRVGDFVPFTDSENVENSIIFNDDDGAFLNRTYGTATAATKFTFSCWFKVGSSTGDQYLISTGTDNGSEGYIGINISTGGGQIWIADPNDGVGFGIRTNAAFRDPSQWYHLCVGVDSTAGSGSRVKVEVNGVEQTVTTLGGATEPSPSQSMNLNEANAFNIGRRIRTSGDLFDGYLANVFFIDGQKKAASDFGQLDTSTNRWIPKAYSSTFGDNGYKLAFGTAPGTGSGAGTDTSGEGHNWTENNFASGDQMIDTPTKNFTTFDPGYSGGGSNVWTEGNTKVKGTDGSLSDSSTTTFGMTGKVVFQFQMNTVGGGYPKCGFITSQAGLEDINATSGSIELGASSVAGSVSYGSGGNFSFASGPTATTFSSVSSLQALDADDVLRYEIDTDTGTIKVFFQNEGSGSFTEITGARVTNFPFDPIFGVRPAVSNFNNSIVTLQTGGQTTLSSVTTDFKEINQDNLDDTASKLTAFAWIKNRDSTDNHMLFDRIRGINNDIHTNSTAIQVTNANTVQRFLQRGVQIGNDAEVNTATESYVLWQWLVGDTASTGSTITAGSVSTGVPSIASTAIAADAGHFSVVQYTGNTSSAQTVGHGLGGVAEAIVVKNLAATSTNWPMLHKDLGSIAGGGGNYILLNDAGVTGANTNYWNDTSPTASVFSIGSGGTPDTNDGGGETFIAYCFRSISGVCKVGSYTGTGSATAGPYVPLGFKPRWIMLKNVSVGRDWVIVDTARTPINTAEKFLFPNLNIAEAARGSASGSDYDIDILSDAFRPLTGDSAPNGDGNTIIYIAMADIGGNGTLPPIYSR
jgi:hypothetical protein